jgi:glutathione S-transferase
MKRMRLYSGSLSMFGAKAQIAALEKDLDVDVIMVPFTNDHRYHPKDPEVVRVNPKHQVPVLIHGTVEIFDSTQIFEYFEHVKPTPALWPADPAGRARARLLEHQSDEVYFPHIIRLMGLQQKHDDPVAVSARAGAAEFYRRMETTLAVETYLAGQITYADIAFYMAQVFGDRMGAPITEATPRLLQWRATMTARPAVRSVIGALVAHLAATDRPIPAWLRPLPPDAT